MSVYLSDVDPGDETDWDAATETRYENRRASVATGLCLACFEDEALPDGDYCRYCSDELEVDE